MKLEVIGEDEIIRKNDKFGISINYWLDKFRTRETRATLSDELTNLREKIDDALSLKFVIVKRSKDENVVIIFHSDHIHTNERANPHNPDSFIGAGNYSFKEIEWGSWSFRGELRRDRPKDPEEARKLLQEVRLAIKDWIERLVQANLANREQKLGESRKSNEH